MDSRELITELGLKVGSELWKYVITNRNIKKQDLLSHHYDIAFNAFRKWFYEDVKFPGIAISVTGGKALVWKIYSGRVEYKSNEQSLIKRVSEPQIEEIQQAI